MFNRKYKVYLDNVWFDSLYGADYYNDKSNFFAHGAQKIFTIYQISRTGDFKFTIVEEISGDKFNFSKCEEFKNWVEENYHYFAEYLDKIYWSGNPESKLNKCK